MSLREGPRKVVIWPFFFDSKLSRSEGRRVPRALSVKTPSLGEVAEAARRAGYRVEVDEKAKHPAHWFDYTGRVLVYTEERKTEVIRKIASELLKVKSSGKKRR